MAVKKNRYDTTSSMRAARHLDKLAESQGQRLPVDLSIVHIEQIRALQLRGYGSSKAAVIRRAIEEAFGRIDDLGQPM